MFSKKQKKKLFLKNWIREQLKSSEGSGRLFSLLLQRGQAAPRHCPTLLPHIAQTLMELPYFCQIPAVKSFTLSQTALVKLSGTTVTFCKGECPTLRGFGETRSHKVKPTLSLQGHAVLNLPERNICMQYFPNY